MIWKIEWLGFYGIKLWVCGIVWYIDVRVGTFVFVFALAGGELLKSPSDARVV